MHKNETYIEDLLKQFQILNDLIEKGNFNDSDKKHLQKNLFNLPEIKNYINRLAHTSVLNSLETMRKGRKEQNKNDEVDQAKILDLFNTISLKENMDARISDFRFSESWKTRTKQKQENPSYWLTYDSKDVKSYYVFPNPMIITEAIYHAEYHHAYDIKNYMYAGKRGLHLILDNICIVEEIMEDDQPTTVIKKKGNGKIE